MPIKKSLIIPRIYKSVTLLAIQRTGVYTMPELVLNEFNILRLVIRENKERMTNILISEDWSKMFV